MKAVVALVCALALMACVAQASDVVVLTDETFDETIKNHEFVLVEFFAPWCGHCKKLAPEYEKAATALKDIAVLASVDCTVQENLASRFGIQGFPTLKFFKRGSFDPIDFQAERNAKAIESWVRSKTEPAVVLLDDKAEFNEFNERLTLARVVLFAAEGEEPAAFAEVAGGALSNEFSFGRVSSAALAEELDQKLNTIVLFYLHQSPVVYNDEMTVEALTNFISTKGHPRLETLVLNQAFINRVTTAQRPMVIAFHENPDQLEQIRTMANAMHEKVHFTETPVSAYPELAAQWGASGTKYPTIIVALWEEGHPTFKAYDEEKDFTVEAATAFVNDCLDDGNCPAYRKSQALPEGEALTAPVKTLVYKNFDQIVHDANKDVLVEFYAPWCGHCKALAPLYEELATVFQSVETLVIAKIDATANYVDPALGIKGFPTLLFFPANDKANPVNYDGKRDFPSIGAWIIDHASHPIDRAILQTAEQAGKDEL